MKVKAETRRPRPKEAFEESRKFITDVADMVDVQRLKVKTIEAVAVAVATLDLTVLSRCWMAVRL